MKLYSATVDKIRLYAATTVTDFIFLERKTDISALW